MKESSESPFTNSNDLSPLLGDLANMQDGGEVHFLKKWEPYKHYKNADLTRLRDELRLLWSLHIPLEVEADNSLLHPVPELSEHALDLMHAWELQQQPDAQGEPLQQFICREWLKEGARKGGLVVNWAEHAIRPNAASLQMMLAWGSIHLRGRFAYCRTPDCPAPFFVARRKDQKFCSEECAAPAKREAKLRWWHENRSSGGGVVTS